VDYAPEELSDFLVLQKARQRFWEPQRIAGFDRIFDIDLFGLLQVFVKGPDAVEIAVDRLWMQPPVEKMVNKRENFFAINLFDGAIDPEHELFERAYVIPYGARGIVFPLE
jgi:hypothetical protein